MTVPKGLASMIGAGPPGGVQAALAIQCGTMTITNLKNNLQIFRNKIKITLRRDFDLIFECFKIKSFSIILFLKFVASRRRLARKTSQEAQKERDAKTDKL